MVSYFCGAKKQKVRRIQFHTIDAVTTRGNLLSSAVESNGPNLQHLHVLPLQFHSYITASFLHQLLSFLIKYIGNILFLTEFKVLNVNMAPKRVKHEIIVLLLSDVLP